MNTKDLLKDIGTRTEGDLYLGVVGPVRSGKSTFIKKFMDKAIIPYIEDEDGVRMVKTPWFEDAIPFDEAAKIGTQKVINDHSTIGIVVTCDGTIADIERENYVEAEREVINELTEIGKPFIVIVNSKQPGGTKAQQIVEELKSKYNVPVIALSVENISSEDIAKILKGALYEFPIANIEIELPSWVNVLEEITWLRKSLQDSIYKGMQVAKKVKDVDSISKIIEENEHILSFKMNDVDTSTGVVFTSVEMNDELYEQVLKEVMGFDIEDPTTLLKVMQEYAGLKKNYNNIANAIEMAKTTGYGFASPVLEEIKIEKPVLVKQGNRYGVKVAASAPTLHIIKVDVDTKFEPIIGIKEQSEALVDYLAEGMDADPHAIFTKEMFGQNMGVVITSGINSKLTGLPDNTRVKLQNLMKTIANKGKTNLIAIVF